MPNQNNFSVSFEVYPASNLAGFRKLRDTCHNLNTLQPNFISVTFGAAGSAQTKTLRTVRQLKYLNIPTSPHISCVNMTKERLEKILALYQDYGINRLIVIRGDHPPASSGSLPEFVYAHDLIAAIRQISGDYFNIIVAAYPEFHPQSTSSEDDLSHFKRKIEMGASCAITQFFFNTDAYLRFRDSCHKNDIKIPIIPGIMPIYDYERLLRISKMCGAEIPLWLRKRLDSLSNHTDSLRNFGMEIVLYLCEKLLTEGVEGLHFYTLNQLNPVAEIYRELFVKNPCFSK